MNKNVKFYVCPICGNVISLIDGDIDHIMCCGREMELLVANTKEASLEKHIPVYEHVEDELLVKVGEQEHPMEKGHYISFIAQVANNNITIIKLYPEMSTEVRIPYIKGSIVYAYCNKHGLWQTKIK